MSKRKIYLIIILFVWIIIGYLVYAKFIRKTPELESTQVIEPKGEKFETSDIKAVLESEEFKNLVILGDLPIRVKDTDKGRENPFISY